MRGLLRLIRAALAPTRYHAQYVCEVLEQSSDWKTLDLLPDDLSMRGSGLQEVPIWHGLPGFDVKVVKGSRVMLGFENGDPTKPYAALWETGQVERVRFMGGEAPVARMGDPVTVYWPATMSITGAIPAGAFTGEIAITTPGIGVIDDGQGKFTV
jgi:hypothetical protein